MDLLIDRIDSPIGEILVVSDGKYLRALDFADYEDRMRSLLERQYGAVTLTPAHDPAGVSTRVRRYLEGDVVAVDGIAVKSAGTPFQEEVWAELRGIPPGQTTSYGEIARRLGKPGSARAVGLANGSNPIAIVVPCHRVIGADGTLTGYGGGLERKRWLLEHEGALLL
ncbi:MAG: methylated-DNA--[protein]-cysteine S-methyltransferase [Gammaproteobacteria bacterium]